MKLRLVRVALRLHPPGWRRRYGPEIEQWLLDAASAEHPSGFDSVRFVADLIGSGLVQRFHRYLTGVRIMVVVALCAASALFVDARSLDSSATGRNQLIPLSDMSLADNALLTHKISLVHSFTAVVPSGLMPQPSRIQVDLVPGTTRVTGVSGPPTRIVVDPQTGRVLSVRPGG